MSKGTENGPRSGRLPRLRDVLSRRTLAPLDLWSFYIFMRDQHRSVDYLDFWLDVEQHTSLCRFYIQELRRSLLTMTPSERATRTDQAGVGGYYQRDGRVSSKTSSLILEQLLDSDFRNTTDFQRVSEIFSNDKTTSGRNDGLHRLLDVLENTQNNRQSYISRTSYRGSDANPNPGSPGFNNLPQSPGFSDHPEAVMNQLDGFSDAELQEMGLDPAQVPRTQSPIVTRSDLQKSAQRIFVKYLIPDAQRQIILPSYYVDAIKNAIEVEGRDGPEVFDAAQNYVFDAMELEPFQEFLMYKVYGNLVPGGSLLCLLLGLFCLFAAFWVAFILIFLGTDLIPKYRRLWLIIPFSFGMYGILANRYDLEPISALMGYSQSTMSKFLQVKEPIVKNQLRQRSLALLGLITVITACLVILFTLVPGKRL